MITGLSIRDLGVIEEASIDLDAGLTAVTGETGAGKTMVVSSIGLLLGQRADPDLVRRGSRRAVVEAVLDADDELAERVDQIGGQVEQAEVVCRRQVLASRRSTAQLGGAQVTAAQLGEVVGEAVTIHGQSEQLRLASPSRQLELLDEACGDQMVKALDRHRQIWDRHVEARAALRAVSGSRAERDLEIEVLRRRIGEVDAVDPQPGEDDEIGAEVARLGAAEELRASHQAADALLNGAETSSGPQPGALALLEQAARELDRGSRTDPQAAGLAEKARGVAIDLADLSSQVAGLAASTQVDPARLDQLQARLASIQRLLRSRVTTLDDLLADTETDRRRLAELTGQDEDVETLNARLAQTRAELLDSARQISALRRRTGQRLAHEVRQEFGALAMPGARLEFAVEDAPMGPRGADAVTIMWQSAPDLPPAPLSRAASGGELSRVRLALEVVLAATSSPRTLVFDEVDAGVGGAVGIEIGRRLADLARRHQVLVVTHLAQVAAFAHTHLVVTKTGDGSVTRSGLRRVDGEERRAELSRMMSGMADSAPGLAHASELLGIAGHEAG